MRNREEFFRAYDCSRDLCMMYQKTVEFTDYYRCYVVGQKKVRIMPYDPRLPHAQRYAPAAVPAGRQPPAAKKLFKRIEQDALTLCRALGYDLNTVEFAVEGGIPYAIDFMNPAPDADLHSVGPANFDWLVEQVAEMAIAKARSAPQFPELRWTAFLGAAQGGTVKKAQAAKRTTESAKAKAKIAKTKKNSLAAEEEWAAAREEPMGSIAAAVPGDDAIAQDAIDTAALPGAEAAEIQDQAETSAGTESKAEGESRGSGDRS